MEQDDFSGALDYYERAAGNEETSEFTPVYLMKVALAAERLGNNETAIGAYNRVIDDFPNSDQVNNAKKYLARLQGAS